jgi:hypothetical protein
MFIQISLMEPKFCIPVKTFYDTGEKENFIAENIQSHRKGTLKF